MSAQFNTELAAALLGFNGEADLYCDGISDTVAHEYAMSYARMSQDRVKGIDSLPPRSPHWTL
jgi:hypothetical protein